MLDMRKAGDEGWRVNMMNRWKKEGERVDNKSRKQIEG